MAVALDTFLVALYVVVDDLYRAVAAPHKPRRRGHRPELSDSEVLTLLIVGQWQGKRERDVLRHAAREWRAYFPRLLHPSAFNRRARDLAGVLTALVPQVATTLGAALAGYHVVDGVPVPLARRCRGTRHRLFGEDEAAIGRGGADRDWYDGCQLWLAVTDEGAISGFVLGPANTDARYLADALWCWRQDPTATPWTGATLPPAHRRGGQRRGPTGRIWPRTGVGAPDPGPYLSDRGLRGTAWATHWQAAYGVEVLTHASYTGPTAAADRRWHAAARQVVETVNAHLTADFGLAFPGARTRGGLLARIAAKRLAFNLGLCLNRLFGRPAFALATLFSW
jgi:hypothetical protein